MPALARVVPRRPWVAFLALAMAVLGCASTVSAQCQWEWRWVSGSSQTGDGSSSELPAGFASYGCSHGPSCETQAPISGSFEYKHLDLVGEHNFTGQHGNYFAQHGVGDATCWRDAQNCLHCSGGFAFTFFSREGAIDGHVFKIPSFTPPAPIWVTAAPYLRQTDEDGYYTFRSPGPANNQWGLPLTETSPGGPGHRTYGVGLAGWPANQLIPTTISSNKLKTVDIAVAEPYLEPPPRCGSCQQPGSSPSPAFSTPASTGPTMTPSGPGCTVGKPVSVTTGNVDLDQTDAAIPGLGLGLRFSRSYNSLNITAGRFGVFGPGWMHSYEKRLTFPAGGVILLRQGDGMPAYYQDNDGDSQFLASAPLTNESWIESQSGGTVYVRYFRRGGSERYEVLSAGTASLTSLTDASGNVTTLDYASGKLTTITDPGGRQLTLTYVGSQIQQLSGPDGPIATFAYSSPGPQGLLQTVTYADGDGDTQADGAFTFAYHPSGRLWTVTDGAGKILETHVYDGGGRAIETKVSGDVEKYTLDYSQPRKTIVTDSLNNVTTYEWVDIWGSKRVTKITGPCSGCGGSGGDVQEWTYDNRGRITSHKDGEGNVTSYTYGGDENDGDGNVIAVALPPASPLGADVPPTTYTYYPDGRMHTRQAPNGSVTTWTYAAAGPETITETVSTGVNRTTNISYTPQGKPHIVTDALGKQTEMQYTSLGDLEWVRDPLLHQTSFEYDAMGRLEKTILPATTPPNDSPGTSYDTLGRVWRVTNPNGSFWRHWYDGGGRRTLTQDPDSEQTEFQYDTYGRLSKVIDPRGGETEYEYDLMSNLTGLFDARDKKTTFAYDGHHRVTTVTYPGATTPLPFEEFTYDLAGRLKTRKDRKGVTTTFAYDGQGRLTGKTYSDGTRAVSFGYDANDDIGFMTSASNNADTLTWDYDLAGQLQGEASTRNATTVSYLYDLAGRRTNLRLNGVDILTYSHHDDGQLDTITRAPGVVFDFNPDAAHRRQDMAFPNGTTTEYGYDLLSRLSLVRLKRGAAVLNEIAYESNNLDNRSSRTENGTRLEYGYDELSRLETVDRTAPTPTARQEEYSYDPVGNRLTALGIPGVWSYSARNELQSYNGINFGYDQNGNQTSRSGSPARTYVWDVENRLTSAHDNGVSVASFEYDALGRRVTKTTSAGLTRFAYDGEDILFEQGPSGNFTYLHGPGIDEPLAREDSGGVRTYYHADGLGSIVKRTKASGYVIASHTYDSFGQATGLLGGYAFTGREYDSESGLHYYRARYYDPKVGQFISEDPVPTSRRTREELNGYSYVMNNPVNHTDPSGRIAVNPASIYHVYSTAKKIYCAGDAIFCHLLCKRKKDPDEEKRCHAMCILAYIDCRSPLPPPDPDDLVPNGPGYGGAGYSCSW